MKKLVIVFSIVLLCLVSAVDAGARQRARSSKSVRQQQRQTEQKIRLTDEQIKENARQLKSKINDLNRLQAESQTINLNINRLQASIDSLDREARGVSDSVATLDARLADMREAFAGILRDARRSRSSMSNLAFIFSSDSFTQAFRRANALKQFSRWRERKVGQINVVKAQLDERRRYLDTIMQQQRAYAATMTMKRSELTQRAAATDKLVASLKGKDADLRKILREQQRQASALDRELNKIIAEEERKARIEEEQRRKREEEQRKAEERRKAEEKRKAEEAARKASENAASGTTGKVTAPKATAPAPKPAPVKETAAPSPKLSSSFAANKGKLSYPVNPHNIVKRFGRQQHPVHKHVMTENAGLDMETTPGATVKSIFDGEVSAIICPDGYNNVVLVRHGSYLTVYANLGTLSVHKGDKVRTGQSLGTVYVDTSDNNRSVLHFEIRNASSPGNITKENPEQWLR